MGSERNEYADSFERIAKSLESIDHSLKLIVTPMKFDLRPSSREIEKMMERHDISMQSISKPNAKRKMVKAVCERCKKESDWHYSEKAAKRELDNKPCK